MPDHPIDHAAFGQKVLTAEAEALASVTLGPRFNLAATTILAAPADAHVVVSGLGKSGLIGQKISATLASTGTPSHFVHAAEASHGDFGRIRKQDIVLLLSYSGGTEEVVGLAEVLRVDGVRTMAITASDRSDLGRTVDICLELGDLAEACPLNLAPTATTTATLAIGDALALAVADARRFNEGDFRRLHPGGGLGKQLMPVAHAMRFRVGENLLLTRANDTIRAAYDAVERFAADQGIRRAGALVIVNEQDKLGGIFTDGDLRRHVMQGGSLDTPLQDIMTRDPRHLTDTAIVRDAVRVVRERRIDEVPVVDGEQRPIGLIDVQDLVALKVIQG